MQRPNLDRRLRLVERRGDAQPHVGGQRRGLGRLLELLDPAAHRFERILRQVEPVAGDILERVERRLRVAGAAERAGVVASVRAQALAVGAEERFEQAQQGAPALHLAAEVMDRPGVRARRVLDGSPRGGEDVPGDGAQSLTHRQVRLEEGLVAHRDRFIDEVP